MQTKNITCKLNIVRVYSKLCYFCEHNRLSLSCGCPRDSEISRREPRS